MSEGRCTCVTSEYSRLPASASAWGQAVLWVVGVHRQNPAERFSTHGSACISCLNRRGMERCDLPFWSVAVRRVSVAAQIELP